MKTTNKKEWPVAIKTIVLAMAGAGLVSLPYMASANPTGGQVVAGNVTIRQESASKIGITQITAKGIIDWQKFSIGANEQVQYYQPSASSITLNRVIGQDPSQILGRLTANGQVVLVNPNGIYFGKNAQIDVAGLVASTHNIRNEDFLAGNYNFNIPGKPGAAVINEGTIRIADTGIAAFVAPSVANRGVIIARLGKVAMAAANGFTLDFHGDQLLSFLVADEVAKTAFDIDGKQLTSFVENSGRIEAQGGYVLLTAKGAENAIHGVINHSGVIEATTVGTKNGEIILHAGKGALDVSGTLDASAPNGGDGGFVDTSGGQVSIAANTTVNTAALLGKNGLWLIDPLDITINSSMATAIISALQHGDVTVSTSGNNTPSTAVGEVASNGDIFVNGAIGWSANKFTLFAHRNIYLNSSLSGSGAAQLALQYGQGSSNGAGSDYFLNNGAKINLPAGNNFSTKQGSAGWVMDFTVITSLGEAGSITSRDLQGMSSDLQGFNGQLFKLYALGSDIDADATSMWNGGEGFSPIGLSSEPFRGIFDGLGHVIRNLTINRPDAENIGLFGAVKNAEIRNIGLLGASVNGGWWDTGGLVGYSLESKISRSYVEGSVSGPFIVGGLVGNIYDTDIMESYFTGAVNGNVYAGGLVGDLNGNSDLTDCFAMGAVSGNDIVGGLIGRGYDSTISNSYSTGRVSRATFSGGLVGHSEDVRDSNSYWDIDTSGFAVSAAGIGKTAAQMQQQAAYVGWDFVNTWVMPADGYPILRNVPNGLAANSDNSTAPPSPPNTIPAIFDANNIGYITNVTGIYSINRATANNWTDVGSTPEAVPVRAGDFIDARGATLQLTFVDGSILYLSTEVIEIQSLQPDTGFPIETTIAESILQNKSVWGQVKTATGVNNNDNSWGTGVRG